MQYIRMRAKNSWILQHIRGRNFSNRGIFKFCNRHESTRYMNSILVDHKATKDKIETVRVIIHLIENIKQFNLSLQDV